MSILPDLVRDSRIESSVSGDTTKHVFYEPGRTPEERQRCRVELWDREGTLGSGAYGTVYRERRHGSSGTADGFRAVKQISKFMLKTEQLDYTRELEAIIKFSHRNYSHCFVRSDGWYETEDSVFISMEYIEAGDLQKYLTGPLPEVEVHQIVKQVLEGIGFMHDNGFVHRDLKPKNIMVAVKGPKWFVKITDFGISKRRKSGVTTLRTLKRGTLGFAAPEVLDLLETSGDKAGSYSFAVDIWSLGALAYYMLTNRMAFQNLGDTARYALGGDFPIGQLKDVQASEKFQDFAKQMLSRKPEGRPTAVSAAAHEWLATPLTGVKQPTNEYPEQWNAFTNLSAASGSWETDIIEDHPKQEPPKYQQPTAQTAKFDSTLRLGDKLPSDHRFVLDEALDTTTSREKTLRPVEKQPSVHRHVSEETSNPPIPRKKSLRPIDKQRSDHAHVPDEPPLRKRYPRPADEKPSDPIYISEGPPTRSKQPGPADKKPSEGFYISDGPPTRSKHPRPADKKPSDGFYFSDGPPSRKKHPHLADDKPSGRPYILDEPMEPVTSIIRVATPDTPDNVQETIKSLEQSLQIREESDESEYEPYLSSDSGSITNRRDSAPRVVRRPRSPPAGPYSYSTLAKGRGKTQQDKRSSYKSDRGFSDPYGDEYLRRDRVQDAKDRTIWPKWPILRATYYCDVLGNLWPSLDLRPETIPIFKSFEEEDDFWSIYERSGRARRLLCSNDVIAGDKQRAVVRPERCFSCFVEVRPLFHARCGHWHCLRCLAWYNSNVTNMATPPPQECSWPVRLIRRLDPAKTRPSQLRRRSTRSIRCPVARCRFTFEPDYIARDFRSGEWVMYCPSCSIMICILCAEAGDEEMYSHPNCPTRLPGYYPLYILPEQPLVHFNDKSQLKELEVANRDRFRTTAQNPWQQISYQGTDKYSNCRQCGVFKEMLRKGDTLWPLKCLHVMCTGCILQWLTLGLVAPTVAGHLCYLCPQRSAVTNISLETDGLRLMDSLGLGLAWKELWDLNMRLRQSRAWVCPYFHTIPVLYEAGTSLPLQMYCRTCRVQYCRWCGSVLFDGAKCPNNRLLEEFVRRLDTSGQLTDPKIRAVLGQQLQIDW